VKDEKDFIPKDIDFRNLVKKARRKSIIKSILISLVICILVLFILYFTGDFIMKKKIENDADIDFAIHEILGANVKSQGTSYNYSLLSATSTTNLVKDLNGIPIPWGKSEKMYNLFGNSRTNANSPYTSATDESDGYPMYFQGERVIQFFHPKISYSNIKDDRKLLDDINEDTIVELAVSFDKGYSISKVKESFNKQLEWFWVDTFNSEKINEKVKSKKSKYTNENKAIAGYNAYGFSNSNNGEPEMDFISLVELLKSNGGEYQKEINNIYMALTNNEKKELLPENLSIVGVVLTGTPDELKNVIKNPMIKGSTLGATTDKY
jgi:hypothetical protein